MKLSPSFRVFKNYFYSSKNVLDQSITSVFDWSKTFLSKVKIVLDSFFAQRMQAHLCEENDASLYFFWEYLAKTGSLNLIMILYVQL